ncbi:MAG: hypothetical protein AAFQ33_04745 [Pseudomonadota bacterium]
MMQRQGGIAHAFVDVGRNIRVKKVAKSVTDLHASHDVLIVTQADDVRALFWVFRNVPPEESVKLRIENSKLYIFDVDDA